VPENKKSLGPADTVK